MPPKNSFSFKSVLLIFLLIFGIFWEHCDSQVSCHRPRESSLFCVNNLKCVFLCVCRWTQKTPTSLQVSLTLCIRKSTVRIYLFYWFICQGQCTNQQLKCKWYRISQKGSFSSAVPGQMLKRPPTISK